MVGFPLYIPTAAEIGDRWAVTVSEKDQRQKKMHCRVLLMELDLRRTNIPVNECTPIFFEIWYLLCPALYLTCLISLISITG
jgi:hypothetical protein